MARTKGALGKNTIRKRELIAAKNSGMPMIGTAHGKYLFRAMACGCEIRKDIIGCGMVCIHKNHMALVNK